MDDMSTETSERIPPLTLGWRLQMALDMGNMKAEDMAQHLDVSRQTLSRWMHDVGAPPKRPFLIQWAMATGTSLAWLATGVAASSDPTPDGESTTPSSELDRLAARKRARHARMSDTARYVAA